jgi:hypothetical protein
VCEPGVTTMACELECEEGLVCTLLVSGGKREPATLSTADRLERSPAGPLLAPCDFLPGSHCQYLPPPTHPAILCPTTATQDDIPTCAEPLPDACAAVSCEQNHACMVDEVRSIRSPDFFAGA